MPQQLDRWLNKEEVDSSPYSFQVVFFKERNASLPDAEIKKYIEEQVSISHRNLSHLKLHYQTEPRESLSSYLESYVFPEMTNQINKNVWQGDFGEILAGLIVAYFQDLEVPIKKIKLKFNKDRSVFSTDMIAHNKDDVITDIYYYEIKTRQNIQNKETVKVAGNNLYNYITVHAHNSLHREEISPNEGIADFLSRYYEDKAMTYVETGGEASNIEHMLSLSKKYHDIVKNPSNYNRKFELFFITEASSYNDVVLTTLNSISPLLSPLKITVLLIDNLNELIESTRNNIIDTTLKLVYDE